MKRYLTLQQARTNRGYEIKQVEALTGISVKKIKRWEQDNRKADVYELYCLLDLYGVSFDHIYIGAVPEEKTVIHWGNVTEALRQMGYDVSELERFRQSMKEEQTCVTA